MVLGAAEGGHAGSSRRPFPVDSRALGKMGGTLPRGAARSAALRRDPTLLLNLLSPPQTTDPPDRSPACNRETRLLVLYQHQPRGARSIRILRIHVALRDSRQRERAQPTPDHIQDIRFCRQNYWSAFTSTFDSRSSENWKSSDNLRCTRTHRDVDCSLTERTNFSSHFHPIVPVSGRRMHGVSTPG